MKRKTQLFSLSLICLFLLSGCWDQRLMKDTRFILAAAYEKSSHGNIRGTYATPSALLYPQSAIITEVEGKTIRDITSKVNNKVSERLDISKLKVILMADKLVKEDGIYPYLDILIREPSNPINPFLMITKGKTSSYFTNPIPDEGAPGEYFQKLVQKEIDKGVLPDTNVLKSSRIFKDSYSDITLPYLKQSKDKTPIVAGVALFNQGKFTGKTLSTSESVIFNLMKNKKNEIQPSIVVKIQDEEDPSIENYISLVVLKSKRKIKAQSKNEQVSGNVTLHLHVSIIESPKYNVEKKRDFLTEQIEKELTKRSNKIIKKLQEANSDGLAIGQHLHSFHYKEFKKLDWKGNAYQKADLTAKVTVSIKDHGLIN